MNAETLREAMRFGSGTNKDQTRLGKYGIGLKSASLSQAKTVIVLSTDGKGPVGRRWRHANIQKEWMCEILAPESFREYFTDSWGPLGRLRRGTLVIWENLEHLRGNEETVRKVLSQSVGLLAKELGIRFHRFIGQGRLTIYLDQHMQSDDEGGEPLPVLPLDPFGYTVSGDPSYPKTFAVQLDAKLALKIECHIWPARSRSPEYRLGGGKVASRQGFYFYRNDRLIRAGGWLGVREDDAEPHLSLARVRVELPPELDTVFRPDITKSDLSPPPTFALAVLRAGPRAAGWSQYIAHAQAVYGPERRGGQTRFPLVPGPGFPAEFRSGVTRALRESGTPKPSSVPFRWKKLPPGVVVSVDPSDDALVLNRSYRDVICSGRDGGAIIELLLLLLMQKMLAMRAQSGRSREWLHSVNAALLACMGNL